LADSKLLKRIISPAPIDAIVVQALATGVKQHEADHPKAQRQKQQAHNTFPAVPGEDQAE
jgi:hypothetical protein